jgi:CMP-N,N'-diacetyllegionaminic acid synthase
LILGVIPARAGSKGIKDKNIYPLCGKPLIDYTIDETDESDIEDYIIATDIESLIMRYGDQVMKRPNYLNTDTSKTITLLQYIVKRMPYVTSIMTLQPTSPLRTQYDINDCLEWYEETRATSLYSGYYMGIKTKNKTYDKHVQPRHFQRNGAIFITSKELILQGKLWDDDVLEYEMPKERSIDIDDMEDMFIAESLIKNGVLNV